MAAKPLIKISHLNVTYFQGQPNEVKSLKNVNIEIYPGELVIFFGPSGCGKSTLLYSMAGLENLATGEIVIDGKNITKMNSAELGYFHQKKTGMIFQSFYLINSLNVIRNVSLPQVALNVPKRVRDERAMSLIKHFGIEPQAKKLPNELSGGQQQRVAICRALVNEPDILFADEPVGNLDSKSAGDVLTLLKDLNTKHKKTIVLVTHDPSHLNIAHRVFYMKDGEVIDVKENLDVQGVKKDSDGKVNVLMSKDLELLARTFTGISDVAGNLLIPFKAKEIVSEVLTEMTAEQMSGIENKVSDLLAFGIYNKAPLFEYLDTGAKRGLNLDKRAAENITEDIVAIVEKIKEVEKWDAKKNTTDYNVFEQAASIRKYLTESLEIHLPEEDIEESTKIIDKGIVDRLDNKIDKNKFEQILDLPRSKNGAGLDKRIARKMAKRLELIMLGKFR